MKKAAHVDNPTGVVEVVTPEITEHDTEAKVKEVIQAMIEEINKNREFEL